MTDLASAGVLRPAASSTKNNRKWVTSPAALRHALVRHVFFRDVPSPSAPRLIELLVTEEPFMDKLLEVQIARTLVGVKRAHGRVPRDLVLGLLRRAGPPASRVP